MENEAIEELVNEIDCFCESSRQGDSHKSSRVSSAMRKFAALVERIDVSALNFEQMKAVRSSVIDAAARAESAFANRPTNSGARTARWIGESILAIESKAIRYCEDKIVENENKINSLNTQVERCMENQEALVAGRQCAERRVERLEERLRNQVAKYLRITEEVNDIRIKRTLSNAYRYRHQTYRNNGAENALRYDILSDRVAIGVGMAQTRHRRNGGGIVWTSSTPDLYKAKRALDKVVEYERMIGNVRAGLLPAEYVSAVYEAEKNRITKSRRQIAGLRSDITRLRRFKAGIVNGLAACIGRSRQPGTSSGRAMCRHVGHSGGFTAG